LTIGPFGLLWLTLLTDRSPGVNDNPGQGTFKAAIRHAHVCHLPMHPNRSRPIAALAGKCNNQGESVAYLRRRNCAVVQPRTIFHTCIELNRMNLLTGMKLRTGIGCMFVVHLVIFFGGWFVVYIQPIQTRYHSQHTTAGYQYIISGPVQMTYTPNRAARPLIKLYHLTHQDNLTRPDQMTVSL
jgi:hypothetical protein